MLTATPVLNSARFVGGEQLIAAEIILPAAPAVK
jgi:hypothetical protein